MTSNTLQKSLPKVSCLCITYGRTTVLNEAVHSFLKQDYPGEKEMVILNDLDQLELKGDFPDVRIYNEKTRFLTIGEKQNAGIELCNGEIILIWDDDDINLPHRISWTVKHMKFRPFYKADRWWSLNYDQIKMSTNAGHAMAGFHKSVWKELGGYAAMNSGYDLEFEGKLIDGEMHYVHPIEDKDAYFIYRWFSQTGGYHTSTFGYGKGHDEAKAFVEKNKIEGVFEIHPQWYQDYLKMIEEYLSKPA